MPETQLGGPSQESVNWQLNEVLKFEGTCGMTEDHHKILHVQEYSLDGFEDLFEEEYFEMEVVQVKNRIQSGPHTLSENQMKYLYFCYFLISKEQFAFFVGQLKLIFKEANNETLCLFVLGKTLPHLVVRLLAEKFNKTCETMWEYLATILKYRYE